jgi:outer membrane protein assembly factor BamB
MALDRKTGGVKWKTPMPDSVLNQIVVHNQIIFCPCRDGNVYALNLADGKPIWHQNISGKAPILAGLAISKDGNTLFAASQDGYLALLSTADGKILDKHALNAKGKPGTGKCFSTPTLAEDKLYIGSETAGLRCFQSLNGSR